MVDRVNEILTVTPRLYDYHPEGQEELLLDTIVRLRASGVPWEEVYKEENFPKIEVDNLENPTGYVLSVRNPLFGLLASSRDKLMLPSLPQWHGVNFAEGMKALPAMYRVTANQSGEVAFHLFTPESFPAP